MTRTVAIGLFCACVVVLGASVFVLVGPGLGSGAPPSARTLLQQAERSVPAPPLPPAPPNARIEREQSFVTRSIQLPSPAFMARHNLVAPVPHVVQQPVDRPRVVGASPQDTAAWQAQVEQLQAAHDKAVAEEIRKLEDQVRASEAAKSPGLVADIVAVLGAVGGLIGAVATLVAALKGTPKAA